MAPTLSGQNCNFLIFFFCLSIPKRDLDTEKKTTPNLEVCPESLWNLGNRHILGQDGIKI